MRNSNKIPKNWFLRIKNMSFEDLIDLEVWRISQSDFKDGSIPMNSDIGVSLVYFTAFDNSYIASDFDIEEHPFYKGFSEITLEYFKKHIAEKKDIYKKVEEIVSDLDSINESTYREILIDAIIKYGSDEFESKEDWINFAKMSRGQLKEHFDSILEYYKNN